MVAGVTPAVALGAVSVARGGRAVIHGVDLVVTAGAWFGLIGANGSGKTSLLRAVAGRLPFAGGTCRLDGTDLAADRAARAGRIGFNVPGELLPAALRVGELFGLAIGPTLDLDARLGPLRAALGLDALWSRRVGDCSAGMRQRVALELAVAGGHRLVILDEPFTWLDPVAAFDVRAALRARVDGGLTLITALHDLATLALACDEGAMLADGRITATLDRAAMREAARDPGAFKRRTIDRLRARRG